MTWRRVVVAVVGLAAGLAQLAMYLGLAAGAVVGGLQGRTSPRIDALLTVLQYPFLPLIPNNLGAARPFATWITYGALIGNALIWGTAFAWMTHRLLEVRTSN